MTAVTHALAPDQRVRQRSSQYLAPVRVGRVYSAQVSPRPRERSRGRRRPAHRRGRIAEGSMLTDLRGFLALLEEQGDLVRITRPCSPEFEIAAGMRKTSD